MIDRSLLLLARMRFVARLRRIRRSLSSPRGIVFFVVGSALFVMWLAPSIFANAMGRHHANPDSVRTAMPLVLLAFTLAMSLLSGGKALSFTAADLDFLFPGPFSRHQLVLYKIGLTAFAAIWVALLLSIWQLPNATLWVAAYVGIWLAWLFAQSMAMLMVLARQAIASRASPLLMRLALGLVLGLIVVAALAIARPMLSGEMDLKAMLLQARDTRIARIVLAPFDVLTQAFTAERVWPDLVRWAAVSALMIVVLIVAILRLDAHFIESSLLASEKLHTRLRRMRGGHHALGTSRPVRGLRIGMLPHMGGIGPLAWRQLMMALRGARGLLLMLILLAMGVGPMLWVASEKESAIQPMLVVGGLWLLFILPSMVRFDFRGDLARIDALKTLPMPAWAVAAGQMLAPVLVLTMLAWLIVSAVCLVIPALALEAIAAAGIAPVALVLVVGLENITFLMFPTAQTMSTPGDMSMMGRTMIVTFAKMIVLMVVLAVAGAASAGMYLLSQSWPLTLVTGWLMLALAGLATVPLVARLFARFDPSMDKPGE